MPYCGSASLYYFLETILPEAVFKQQSVKLDFNSLKMPILPEVRLQNFLLCIVLLGCSALFIVIFTTYINQNEISIKDCVFNSNSKLIMQGTTKVRKIALWSSQRQIDMWNIIPTGEIEVTIKCPANCMISRTKSSPLDYDALLFHPSHLTPPPKERTQSQVYIVLNDASPLLTSGGYIKRPNFFNWTATYRSNSEVQIPFWYTEKKGKRSSVNIKSLLPQMNKKQELNSSITIWLVSTCITYGQRENYVNQLKKHLKVDIHGGCGEACGHSTCLQFVTKLGKYKFYLAFENSACSEYISDMSADAFRVGLVPIVFGAISSEQYIRKFPPNSFIDTRNFSTPEHLAKYLKHLDSHEEEYLSFHAWRLHYRIIMPNKWCLICNALHNTSLTKHRNVNFSKFFSKKECQLDLIDRLIGKNQ